MKRKANRRSSQLVLLACMSAPVLAYAQAPWIVTLTPTMNPLPVGGCAAIHLTLLDPSSRDVPRNPLGQRVTIADFDITVTTPNGRSAAPQYIDAYHVSACGCKGASPGTVATATATYPAQGLAAKSRIPDVAFQQSATFMLSAPRGDFNPPSCAALATGARPEEPATSVPTGPVASAPVTVAPTPPVALPNQPTSGAETPGAGAVQTPLTFTVPALSLTGMLPHRLIRTFTTPQLSLNGPAPVPSIRTFTVPQLMLLGRK